MNKLNIIILKHKKVSFIQGCFWFIFQDKNTFIYPIPASDTIYINGNTEALEATVYNINGQKLLKQCISNGKNNCLRYGKENIFELDNSIPIYWGHISMLQVNNVGK